MSSEEQIYIEEENKAFQNLCSYIQDELLVTPKVVTMAFLRAKMITMMNDVGVEVIKDSTKKHLKRNLEQEFESTLHISLTATVQLLFVPQTMSVDMLAEICNLRQKVEKLEATDLLQKEAVITKVSRICAQ